MAITPYNPGSGLTYQQWVAQQLAGMNGPSQADAKQSLMGQSAAAGGFADTAQGNYNNLTAEGQATRDYLASIMRGDNSVAKEQLRQGLQQTVGQLRSQAAAASPANSGMAALQASNNIGHAGAAMAGNAALAGIQERNAAANALGQMQLGYRGQDVNAALGSRGNAIQGYGTIVGQPHQPSWWERGLSAIGGGAGLHALSDKRTKTEIADGDEDADRLLEGLKAYTYRYKDERNGKGKRVGILAQDIEKVAPHAVVETEKGKAIHGAHLATALAAGLGRVAGRLAKLERGK
jgi:hypothetical protein